MTCTACQFVAESARVLLRRDGFILHAITQPTPVRGWLVLTSERHARAWYDLTAEEAAAVGALAREVMQAQLESLHAEHVYAFAIGDVLQHFHLHLVPRFATTPAHHRGRAAFDAPAAEAISEAEAAGAANEVKTYLERSAADVLP
ncbi:MAG: HIT family protein [Archangium sp.]|nr:HIT family protein [Archangium sp.]